MTYKQFLKILEQNEVACATGHSLRIDVKQHWSDSKIEDMKERQDYRWYKDEYQKDLANEYRECIYMVWVGETQDGGSCWNEDNEGRHYTRSGEPEPIEFKKFDDVLRAVCPNITYLQYKEIAPLIQRGCHKIDEYYGNYTYYEYKVVWLKDLYDALKKLLLLVDKKYLV